MISGWTGLKIFLNIIDIQILILIFFKIRFDPLDPLNPRYYGFYPRTYFLKYPSPLFQVGDDAV